MLLAQPGTAKLFIRQMTTPPYNWFAFSHEAQVLGNRVQMSYIPAWHKTDSKLGDYMLAVPMKAFPGQEGGDGHL